jgi:hypothetical protein
MKIFRTVIPVLIGLVFILGLESCKKCKKEDPRARIINQATQKASVQIKTSGGNTVNMNNVQPGTTSDYASYAAGEVVFTISVGNKTDVVSTVNMETCYEYDIAIDENGIVHSTALDRND